MTECTNETFLKTSQNKIDNKGSEGSFSEEIKDKMSETKKTKIYKETRSRFNSISGFCT
jgi:hypothetical protein